jgi:hypothetical protein
MTLCAHPRSEAQQIAIREPSTPQNAPSHGSWGHPFCYFRPLGFSPDVFEAAGRERGVPDRALDRAMA